MGMIIYQITNTLNGKQYVGLTTRTLEHRMMEHFKYHVADQSYLHRSMMKHGSEHFTFGVLEECATIEALMEAESRWIASLGTLAPHGYNLTSGGENPIPSEETRRKLSAAGKGRPAHPNTIASTIATHSIPVWRHLKDGTPLDKWPSAVAAAEALSLDNASIGHCAKPGGKRRLAGGWMWSYDGVPQKPYERKKYSRPRGSLCSSSKRVAEIDPSGATVQEFESQTAACLAYGLDPSSLTKQLNGKIGSVKGRRFKRL